MKQQESKNSTVKENNSGELSGEYMFLQKGEILPKEVYGLPMPEDIMSLLVCGRIPITQLTQSKKMLTQAFSAIFFAERVPCVVAGLSLFDSEKKLVANIALRGINDSSDLVACHRLMLLLEKLPIIDLTENIYIVGELLILPKQARKDEAAAIGISSSAIEAILKKYPEDMQKQMDILKGYGINVPVAVLQEAILARKIELTPEMKKRGVLPAEEVIKKNKDRKDLLKPYYKFLSLWFGEEFSYKAPEAFLAEKHIREATSFGVNEKDFILAYTLTEATKIIIKSSSLVVSQIENLSPEIFNEQEIFWIKNIEAQREAKIQQEVIEFLISLFPETGRTAEDYQLFLLDIKDKITTSLK